jgi:Uma2 family endonuclease
MAAQRFTEAEYLALEAASDRKHEFVDGAILLMAGASPAHNVLATNVATELAVLLRDRDCVVMNSDQRVHVPATGMYTYPDVTVGCGERRYESDNPPSLNNPIVLAEVTSDSTEDHDRGTKWLHYQAIPSLTDYLIVSHRSRRIDHYRRLDTGQWLQTTATADGSALELALGCTVQLGDVYRKVDLSEGRSTPGL